MAREYARLRVSVWDDGDFRTLDPLAQWLYLHLLTQPTLSFCGVVDWRPKRVVAKSDGLTVEQVEEAAKKLVAARFIVLDDDTEEALVRSFVRHDGLLWNPNVTAAMVREFGGIASRLLRGVIVHELRRLRVDEPDARGWVRARVLLDRESIDPYPAPAGPPDDDRSSSGSTFGSSSGSSSGRGSDSTSGSGSESGSKGLGEHLPHSLLPTPSPSPVLPAQPAAAADAGVREASGPEREPEQPVPQQPPELRTDPLDELRRRLDGRGFVDVSWSLSRSDLDDVRALLARHGVARLVESAVAQGRPPRSAKAWLVAWRELRDRPSDTDRGPSARCPQHPDQPARSCGKCAAAAVPMPEDVREQLRRNRSRRGTGGRPVQNDAPDDEPPPVDDTDPPPADDEPGAMP